MSQADRISMCYGIPPQYLKIASGDGDLCRSVVIRLEEDPP
jgi:hypothetical protein